MPSRCATAPPDTRSLQGALSLRPDRESRAPATADQTPSGRPEPQLSTAHKQGTHLRAPHPPVSIVRSEPSARIPACPSTFGPRPEPEDASRCERVRKRLRSREPVDTFNSVPAFDASILQKSRKASCLLQVLHWIPFLSRSPRNPKNGTSSRRPPEIAGAPARDRGASGSGAGPAPSPVIRTGTRSRAGAAPGTCPRSPPVRERCPGRSAERGHVVAPRTALGTCPRSAPACSNSGISEPSVADLFPVRTGTRSRAVCELSPAGTKENSHGFQPGDSRRAQIESRRDDRIRIGSQMYLGSHSIPCRLRNVNNSSLPVL